MRKILFIISLGLILIACSNDKIVFDSEPNLYFPDKEMTYSWFGKVETTATLNIPCNIVGQAPADDKSYRVVVVADKTTAVEDVHYAKFPETMTWKKGQFNIMVPITIFGNDPLLSNNNFVLTIKLQEGADLGVNYDGNLQYTITMTAQVTKPLYWDTYTLSSFFGAYSKIKHSIIVQLTGRDFPASAKDYKAQAAYWQNIGMTTVRDYFIENPKIKDENGIIIAPW